MGRSYGGVVITEAGAHPAVDALFYIASFNLDAGDTAMSAAVDAAEAVRIDHSGRPDALASIRVEEDGTSTVDPSGAVELSFNDCDDDVSAWAVARLRTHPMVTLSQSPATVAWRQRPSTYAVCTLDNIAHPELQRILAKRADHALEWETGHSPFLSRPDRVAGTVAEMAGVASLIRPGGELMRRRRYPGASCAPSCTE